MSQADDMVSAVSRVALFQGLDRGSLDALAAIAELRSVPSGAAIFAAGDAADSLYAVLSGLVRVYRSSLAGREQILHVFGPGDVFGEAAVFQGGSFPASAQAMEEAVLLRIPRERFKRLLAGDAELAMTMLGLLGARLRHLVRRIDDLSLKEVPARLASHLLLLAATTGTDEFDLDLPKGVLASYLGTIPETLSRALKRMADQGLIDVRGARIRLVDRDALEELAAGQTLG